MSHWLGLLKSHSTNFPPIISPVAIVGSNYQQQRLAGRVNDKTFWEEPGLNFVFVILSFFHYFEGSNQSMLSYPVNKFIQYSSHPS
jgi:hypothetical protein